MGRKRKALERNDTAWFVGRSGFAWRWSWHVMAKDGHCELPLLILYTVHISMTVHTLLVLSSITRPIAVGTLPYCRHNMIPAVVSDLLPFCLSSYAWLSA